LTIGVRIILSQSELLTEEDFAYIRDYLEISKPLARAIDELQAEKIAITDIYYHHC
jgi:HD-GYP domain-containing protein (c-di-GMP phosphodiesterase class II)